MCDTKTQIVTMNASESTLENITIKKPFLRESLGGLLYPDTFEQKISFNIIRQLLKEKCLCSRIDLDPNKWYIFHSKHKRNF